MNVFKKIAASIKYGFRYLRLVVLKVSKFISYDIWNLDASDLTRWKARLVRDIKTCVTMFKTFAAQKIGFQATALSYQSTMSIVPLLAIGLYLTDNLGISDKLEAFLIANINDQDLIDILMNAANTILDTAHSGLFGFLSMLTFVWIVIWMMICVRRVFNNVWNVEKESNFFKMIGVVFGVIILSPFIILLFFSGSIVYSHVLDLLVPDHVAFSDSIRSVLSWVIFGLVAILMLAIMFKYIPGCKVRFRNAFKSAVIAGILFTALQALYLETQLMVAKMSAVYGVVAALPLFMIWLNLGWSIILYGAELSYAMQVSETVDK
ncbi:MAG: YihY/virulence factor BrkB family protein [Bacteroidales bacterium]|nr:YihY/virulence factor BrkB family protein [Bacteroidales bacterium]